MRLVCLKLVGGGETWINPRKVVEVRQGVNGSTFIYGERMGNWEADMRLEEVLTALTGNLHATIKHNFSKPKT